MVGIAGTGNETCDKLMNIDFNGNVIHAIWFKTILKENGKADLIAINILADIVYWYRPTQIRDEDTGKVVGYRKKFKADLLQRNYDSYADQFGLSKRQVADAFSRLEKLGIIKRVFRMLNVNGMLINNVLHIELDFDGLVKYSTEKTDGTTVATPIPKKSDPYHEKKGEGSRKNVIGVTKKRDSYPEKKGDLPRKKETPPTPNAETNTKTTTEITTKTTTEINNNIVTDTDSSAADVQEYFVVVDLLKAIGTTEEKAVELLSEYGIKVVKEKLYILSQQKDISNPVGFIVRALAENYMDPRVLIDEQKKAAKQKSIAENKRLGEQSLLVQEDEISEVELLESAKRKAITFQGSFCAKYKLLFNQTPDGYDDHRIQEQLVNIFSSGNYKNIPVYGGILTRMVDAYFKTSYPQPHGIWHFLSDAIFIPLAEKCCEENQLQH